MSRRANQHKREKVTRGFRRVVRITKKIVTAGPVYERFGEAVRDARVELGIRQEDLGLKIGLSRTSVVNIEQGRQRVMLDDLFVFAKALRVSPQKLLTAIQPR